PLISPGMTVSALRSMTLAPSGIATLAAGPTASIRSPATMITALSIAGLAVPSNSRPALMAIRCGPWGDSCAANPASAMATTTNVQQRFLRDMQSPPPTYLTHDRHYSELLERQCERKLNCARVTGHQDLPEPRPAERTLRDQELRGVECVEELGPERQVQALTERRVLGEE